MRRLVPLICLLALSGCGSTQPAPTPPPKSPLEAALDAELDGEPGDAEAGRVKIREAAADHIKTSEPEAEVKGMAIRRQRYDYNLYVVWVDVSKRGQRYTEPLAVRLYVMDSGGTYWKAEPFESYIKSAANRVPCEGESEN